MRKRAAVRLIQAITMACLFSVVFVASAFAESAATGQPTSVTQTTATLNGTVDATGALSVGSCTFNYGTTTAMTQSTPCTPTPSTSSATAVTANVTNLTAGTKYYYDVVLVTNDLLSILTGPTTQTGAQVTFTTASATPAPDVTVTSATNISPNSATFNGTVNPHGQTVTQCDFSYSTDPSFSNSTTIAVPCATPYPAGSSAVAVKRDIAGLQPSTTYYVGLWATTAGGTTYSTSPNYVSFTTLPAGTPTGSAPTVATGPASVVTSFTAVVTGAVIPNGQTITSCDFDYGTSTAYGNQVACSSIPSGSGTTAVTGTITGLKPGTTYDFQLVVTTSAGAFAGANNSFLTPGAPAAVTGSAYSITTSGGVLSALVNVHGDPVYGCGFEYGVTPMSSTGSGPYGYGSYGGGYGALAACTPTPSGTGNVVVTAKLTGLKANTTYYYRIVVLTTGGYGIGATNSFTTSKVKKPGVKITKSKITKAKRGKKNGKAVFTFKATSAPATKAQCALATVRKGHVGSHRFTSCRSPRTYKNLKHKTTYQFFVREGNSAGYGSQASKRFTV